jgi:hypothetical protein
MAEQVGYDSMSINVTLDYEKIKNIPPGQLEVAMKEALHEAISIVADIIVEAAKQIVPVDTGTLQKSIRKEVAENLISVIAGGADYINPKTGKPCNYAPHVNARQPFMMLALKSAESDIIREIELKVEEKLAGL